MVVEYTLADIVSKMAQGKLLTGEVFEGESGVRIGHKHGELYWLTSGGYVSTPVYLNEETAKEKYYQVVVEEQVETTFIEALEALLKGSTERAYFTAEGRQYTCESPEEFETLVSEVEYLADLYQGKAFIDLKQVSVAQVKEPAETFKATVEPAQLESGAVTTGENLREAEEGHKLTSAMVYSIHKMYHQFKKPTSEIADEFKITMRMVQYIIEGKRWNHVYKKYHLAQTR